MAQKIVFRDFPPLGVRLAKTETAKKLRNFGDKFFGRPDFPLKSASSSGKLRFSVFRPEFAKGQNGLENQYFANSCPWGSGRPQQKT